MVSVNVSAFHAASDPDHTAAVTRAVAALAGRPGRVQLPAGQITLSSTIFLPSNVHVRGEGVDRTLVVFRGQHPDRIGTRPRIGILRSSAFVAAGVCPDDKYDNDSRELGDYYISAPRPFVGTRAAGTQIVTTNRSYLDGIAAGDWIHVCSGPSGWHSALSEMARVVAVGDTTLSLSSPLDNHYDTGSDGLGAFIARFDHTANPPGGARIDLWPHTGFRLIKPVENVTLSDFAIANLNKSPQYGGRAYCLARARNCSIRNISIFAGEGWHIDCQDIHCDITLRSDTHNLPVGLLFNGSNRIDLQLSSKEGSLLIEEGVQRLTLRSSQFNLDKASIIIGQYCSNIRFIDVKIVNTSSYGISIRKSCNVVIGGEIIAAGSAIRYETAPAEAPAAAYSTTAPYFDGRGILLDHCYLESTRNPGYDLWLHQPISARDSILTGAKGAPYLAIPGHRHGAIFGSLIRRSDGYQFGTPN